MVKKIVVSLVVVLVVQAIFEICLVSANQLLVPRNMPLGVTGPPSPVVAAVAPAGLDLTSYEDQAAATTAVERGEQYGAYITGKSGDTLIVAPAKSFFGFIDIKAAFLDAAHKMGRPLTVKTVKPLPSSDPIGAVTGLLLVPLLIGGLLAAVFVFKAAGGKAAAPWRVAILVGYSLVGALLTDLICGPGIGAYSNSHFWPLLPCFWLITSAVTLTAAAIQAVAGKAGTVIVLILLVVVGLASSGGFGAYLLPVYWRNIGALLPPQNAIDLINSVLYFGGHNITTPLIVLFLWALAGAAVIGYLGRIRPARKAAAAHAPADMAQDPSAGRRRGLKAILVALGTCAVMQCLFATNYMSAQHAPEAVDLPFGVTGSSPVLATARKDISLEVTQYPDEAAVRSAIDKAKIWGGLVTSGTSNTLLVVPSISDYAALPLTEAFETAAKRTGQQFTVKAYMPVPLAPKDPIGLVPGIMLAPLLIGGYMSSTLLIAATGKAAGRWRAATLLGFGIVAGLVVDLIVCLWLEGFSSHKFWIVWPICSLIITAVAFFAAILQKLIGAAGTLLTVIVIILFGNPSSGGSTGYPFLPTFWRDIGPFLPPRNGYVLLHNTIYFNGHGTAQALTVLLLYFGIGAVILGLLDWFRSEAPMPADVTEGAAMTSAAAGGLP
ncbi:hypothetical protein [Streptomyces viridochromogenes]|uniref:hypothetical protein n=1 Tax=Streptomyces viridochromogenes TaxID=1938 RepID=UPI000A3A1C54|nr:hypothetical protein [Streptomyces viridochromogenes]